MKLFKKTLFLFILIISLALFLTSCKGKNELSFASNGGTNFETVQLEKNEEYTLPTPTREGYSFSGWYLNEDFSGDSITSIKINKNTTVYAKWESLLKITLNPDGGTISKTIIYGKEGDTVLDLVKDLVPTKTDLVFGAWFNENLELSSNAKLTKDLTLTAKYKVEYTVNVYKEKLSHDGYDKEEIKLYDYIGRTVSYDSDSLEGFYEVNKTDTVDEITLAENKESNVLTLYFNREQYTVTFRSNYPNSSKTEETKVITLYYGEEVELPDVDFEFDGYYLLGFAQSNNSEVIYNAHLIDNLPVNKETDEITKEKITVNRTQSLYAIWNKGYRDMFGGSDYIFVAPDEKTAYLSRAGIYFVGEYFKSDNSFIFYNDKENLEGRVYDDQTFAYYNVSRDEYSAVLYTVGSGLDESIKILFDAYNGITYYDGNQDVDNRESKGTYTIDENNFYHVTFTEGLKKGESMIIIVGRVNADNVTTDAFQLRKENEYEMGELVRFAVVNSELTYYLYAYQIELSGFGTLTFNNGESTETYHYSYDEEKDLYTVNSPNGSNFGVIKIIENDGKMGYMFYDENLDQTFEGLDGSKLVLDGIKNAVYTKDNTSVSGNYEIKTSVFGGYIVTFKSGGTEYTFLTSSKTEETLIDSEGTENSTETITTYSFVVKPNGYNEYYYKDETSIYYAPLVVINDTEEGKANVYGFTADRTFELVLEGTYVYDENTNLYVFTTTKVHNKKVLTSPVDIKEYKSFVFAIDSSITQYSINYWYSSTNTSDETLDYKKEYKNSDNSSVLLVNGIAILSKDGYVITGTYSKRGSITIISNQNQNVYVELNDSDNTFIVLDHSPYNAYVVQKDGSYSTKDHFEFDGKGNVTHVITKVVEDSEVEEKSVGIIVKTGNKNRNGNDIYTFVGEESFNYLLIHKMEGSFVYPITEYIGEFRSSDGILFLDGYLDYVSYTNTNGDEEVGKYTIIDTNLIKVTFDDSIRYFDLNGTSFTLKGIEYGTYIVVENQGTNQTYLDLDGYGKAIVYTKDSSDNKTIIDSAATYTQNGEKYIVNYTKDANDFTLQGFVSTYKSNGEIYDAFIIEKAEQVHTFINTKDWSILKLDSKGNAVRVDNKGIKSTGTYTIITDNLLYFESTDGLYANIYKYNKADNEITEAKFVPRGYYTKELKSILFTQYGFAVFNSNTIYYYNVTNDGVVIYLQDVDNPLANKYGFVEENFGSFDNVKDYKGDTYYQNDGFAITFTRKEETKDLYPVLVSRNPETRAPLDNLSFSPTGNDIFNSQGTVIVGPLTLNCTVVREYVEDHYEMYVLVGYYRFDITVNFSGKNDDGSSNSTYEVTGMSCTRTYDPYKYLDNYYMYYLFYGQSFVMNYKNNIGQISMNQLFNEAGEMTDDYMIIDFKEATNALDLDGNLLNSNHASYEFDEQGNAYTITADAADGYTYKYYILIRTHPAFNRASYIIYAVTRLETITNGDYELNIERIITSDYNFPVGGVFSAKLKQGENEFTSTESFELDGVLHYVARTYDEETKLITSTTYYKLDLVLKDSESLNDNVVVPYESVTVTPVSATTYYTEDQASFIDIVNEKIVFISIEGSKYLISECNYDSETKTYTIILNNLLEYTVKMNDDSTITLTKIVEETEEPQEEPTENE